MSTLSPPPSVSRARVAAIQGEKEFSRVQREANDAVRDARDKARDTRKALARVILEARREFFPSLGQFTAVVAARLELSPRTVRNALRDTFSADVLDVCIDVLAEARTRVGEAA